MPRRLFGDKLAVHHAVLRQGRERSVGAQFQAMGVSVGIAVGIFRFAGFGGLHRTVIVMVRMPMAMMMRVMVAVVAVRITIIVGVLDFETCVSTRHVNERNCDEQKMLEEASHDAFDMPPRT